MTIGQKIAKTVFLAQVASDGGKGIYGLVKDHSTGVVAGVGYGAKDRLVMDAISMINRYRVREIRFSVSNSNDFGPCFIVYFDFKVNGQRQQVSFHSFNTELERFAKSSKKSTWKKSVPSREVAGMLASNNFNVG